MSTRFYLVVAENYGIYLVRKDGYYIINFYFKRLDQLKYVLSELARQAIITGTKISNNYDTIFLIPKLNIRSSYFIF
ncbi:hypothetical protein SAMN05216175_10297 [Neptunomonas qingdaonensis]|uniref:Uncharacterized protein n=1 Tax=Neptunomonas qingdaonensis TaxID=1045558 RepID=A0A1I2MWK4_9GAMM|nr:hypothetical protein SAMN05216175_10297 [Neptunomonas qingdaonensis]